jgi:hypothetical protein
MPISKNDKSKSESKNDFGDVSLFREVRYWVYKRRRLPEAPLGRYWHAKIKMKNHPELRFSTGKESHSLATDFVKEQILVSLFKVESGQTVKARKCKDVAMVCG